MNHTYRKCCSQTVQLCIMLISLSSLSLKSGLRLASVLVVNLCLLSAIYDNIESRFLYETNATTDIQNLPLMFETSEDCECQRQDHFLFFDYSEAVLSRGFVTVLVTSRACHTMI